MEHKNIEDTVEKIVTRRKWLNENGFIAPVKIDSYTKWDMVDAWCKKNITDCFAWQPGPRNPRFPTCYRFTTYNDAVHFHLQWS